MAVYSSMVNENRVDLASHIPLPAPFIIQLEASGFCNLNCSFCPVNDEKAGKYFEKKMMTVELFDKFIYQCKCFPHKIKVLRLIGNGEPTLNKNLASFVEKAKKAETFERIEITTNGTLLTKDLSLKLISAGLDTLKVSLEAIDEDTFFDIAKVKINIDSLFENIKFFYDNRCDCKLYIKTTNIALNDDKIDVFLNKWGEICDYIFIENISDIWPEFSGSSNLKRYNDTKEHIVNPICIQPFELLSVTADGDVMPCCADWKRKLLLGNINKNPLIDIWNGEELRNMRINLLKKNNIDPCIQCGFPAVSQRDYIDDRSNYILRQLGFKSL